MNARITLACIVALVVTTLTVTATTETFAQFQGGGVDKEGTWHVGEGLKKGDYFSYSMCHWSYKECVEFRLDLWIRGEIQVGSATKWIAETVVYDGSDIIVGNMELGKVAPEPTGGTENIKTYRSAFKYSIVWLSAYATAYATADTVPGGGPKAFKDVSWSNKLCDPGCERPRPLAIEQAKAADKTWDTVIIGWRSGGTDSKIWVVDDFPFPVKAKTFLYGTEGIPTVEYEFILLDYKEGITENPFADIIPTSKLEAVIGCEEKFDKDTTIKKQTIGAMYQVHISYSPEESKEGCNMQWLIKFFDKYDDTEFLNQVQFDVLTTDSELRPIRSIAQEEGREFLYSPSGQYPLEMRVKEEPGVVNYVIWIYGLSPEHIVPITPNDYTQIPITIIKNDKLTKGGVVIDTMIDTMMDEPVQDMKIPDWVKNNAGWWAEGLIDDDSFVQGIQFLINEKIIQIPPSSAQTDSTITTDQTDEIPEWVKSNAKWWAQGIIDDNTFVQAIQFLIQSGIMVIS